MAVKGSTYRSISQDELLASVKTKREFEGILFSSHLELDEVDLSSGKFNGCLFDYPVLRAIDLSEATFKDCKFAPSRFTSCKFTDTQFENCTFFDPDRKLGCTFAFCDLRAIEAIRCNFSVNSFERCDLYNLSATECGFRGTKFHGSTFNRAISRKVELTRAKFDQCNFSFADMSGLSLPKCELLSCKFSDTALFDVDLTDAVMTGSIVHGAEWNRAK